MSSTLQLPDCIPDQEGQLPSDVNAKKVLSSERYNLRVNAEGET
jgi:hypothetical protein